MSIGVDWRMPAGDATHLAAVPHPDVVMWPAVHDAVVDLVLAVEVLSPSDRQRVKGTMLTRAEATRLDYAAGGLPALVEVDAAAGTATVFRLEGGELVEVTAASLVQVEVAGTTVTFDFPALLGARR